MRVARIRLPGSATCFARLVGDEAEVLNGAPWEGGTPTGVVHRVADVTLEAPVVPSKVVAAGRNYRDHILEMGYEIPSQPTVFLKPTTSIISPGSAVVLPPVEVSNEVEHEAELAVVIGTEASRVSPAEAARHVFGYTIANDVSARDLQRSDPTLARGKGWDTFCPTGPWIETNFDPGARAIRCRVNGVTKQDGTTADLMFGVDVLISYISQFMRLLPGDLVLTGSPGGSSRMEPGDTIEIEVEGIGVLTHTVEADPTARV